MASAHFFPTWPGTFPGGSEPAGTRSTGAARCFFTFADRMGRAIQSDRNEERMIAYQVVKDQVDNLIKALLVRIAPE